jgi:hypothetical protein|tara:strand:+ start:2600 stop:2896 length:297 start_codon:yes stop_codon:yes gene_type:complete
MAKKKEIHINPWNMKTYEVKDCLDCDDDKADWGVVESVAKINTDEAKKLSDKRLEICKKCPHSKDLFSRGWINYCNICGCMLKAKTRLASSKCPDGRW